MDRIVITTNKTYHFYMKLLSSLGKNIISELQKHIYCSFYRFIDMRGLKGTNIQYCIKSNILIRYISLQHKDILCVALNSFFLLIALFLSYKLVSPTKI